MSVIQNLKAAMAKAGFIISKGEEILREDLRHIHDYLYLHHGVPRDQAGAALAYPHETKEPLRSILIGSGTEAVPEAAAAPIPAPTAAPVAPEPTAVSSAASEPVTVVGTVQGATDQAAPAPEVKAEGTEEHTDAGDSGTNTPANDTGAPTQEATGGETAPEVKEEAAPQEPAPEVKEAAAGDEHTDVESKSFDISGDSKE